MSTKESEALAGALLTILVLISLAFADVITTYNGGFSVTVVPQPVIPWLQTPSCGGAFSAGPAGFARTLYACTLQTTSGYQLTSLLSDLNTAVRGEFSLSLNAASLSAAGVASGNVAAYAGATANGAPVGQSQVYPASEFPLNAGTYALKQTLLFSRAPVNSALQGAFNYSIGGAIYSYDLSEKVIVPSGNAFNLLNGVGSFSSSYVYQGDNDGLPSSSYPEYYSSSNAPSGYWSTSSVDQPVYELVAAQSESAGTVFWNENYGGNDVTMRVIATYGGGSSQPADGIEVYMFLDPEGWAANSNYDDSIPYSASGTSGPDGVGSFSPIQGDVMLPASGLEHSHYLSVVPENYLVVQWDPYWQTRGTAAGATGQFNVWIVTSYFYFNWFTFPYQFYCQVSPSPSPNLGNSYSGWDGVGTGYFLPKPKDYVCLTVTYDGSNNSIYGNALDLNTGQVATLSLSLGNAFTNPSSGPYIFGVGGSTGNSYNNWGFTLVNYASR
ncbi:hypothetical protein [Tardisphaera saccharovorans]